MINRFQKKLGDSCASDSGSSVQKKQEKASDAASSVRPLGRFSSSQSLQSLPLYSPQVTTRFSHETGTGFLSRIMTMDRRRSLGRVQESEHAAREEEQGAVGGVGSSSLSVYSSSQSLVSFSDYGDDLSSSDQGSCSSFMRVLKESELQGFSEVSLKSCLCEPRDHFWCPTLVRSFLSLKSDVDFLIVLFRDDESSMKSDKKNIYQQKVNRWLEVFTDFSLEVLRLSNHTTLPFIFSPKLKISSSEAREVSVGKRVMYVVPEDDEAVSPEIQNLCKLNAFYLSKFILKKRKIFEIQSLSFEKMVFLLSSFFRFGVIHPHFMSEQRLRRYPSGDEILKYYQKFAEKFSIFINGKILSKGGVPPFIEGSDEESFNFCDPDSLSSSHVPEVVERNRRVFILGLVALCYPLFACPNILFFQSYELVGQKKQNLSRDQSLEICKEAQLREALRRISVAIKKNRSHLTALCHLELVPEEIPDMVSRRIDAILANVSELVSKK